MDKEDSNYKKLSKLLKAEPGEGHSIAWHIKNGNEVYRKVFLYLLRRIEENEEAVLQIPYFQLRHATGIPSAALTYPLYKFEEAGLLTVKRLVKAKGLKIDPCQVEKWSEVCRILQK